MDKDMAAKIDDLINSQCAAISKLQDDLKESLSPGNSEQLSSALKTAIEGLKGLQEIQKGLPQRYIPS